MRERARFHGEFVFGEMCSLSTRPMLWGLHVWLLLQCLSWPYRPGWFTGEVVLAESTKPAGTTGSMSIVARPGRGCGTRSPWRGGESGRTLKINECAHCVGCVGCVLRRVRGARGGRLKGEVGLRCRQPSTAWCRRYP